MEEFGEHLGPYFFFGHISLQLVKHAGYILYLD